MTDLGTVAFSTAPTTAPTVVVDPGRTFQTMTGFGAAITDSSAAVLYTLAPQARADMMASLFSPTTGDGLDYLRQPIGASDFVATADYTFDDMPAGQTDYAAGALQHRARPGADPAAAAPGRASQPAPADPGDAVEPAGLDEDR